jgi:hypothetical protein
VEEEQPGELEKRTSTTNRKALTRASSLRRKSVNLTANDGALSPRHEDTSASIEKAEVRSEPVAKVVEKSPSPPPPPRQPPPPMRRESAPNLPATTPPRNDATRLNLLSQISALKKD